MLLAALLLLLPPLPDPRSAHGHPLYMRVPPSTLQGELARGRGRGLRQGALSLPSPLIGPFSPFCAPVAPLCWQKGRELRHRWERKGETEAGREGTAGKHCQKVCFPEGSGSSREEGAQGSTLLATWAPRWGTRPTTVILCP